MAAAGLLTNGTLDTDEEGPSILTGTPQSLWQAKCLMGDNLEEVDMSTNHAVFGIYANRERVEEAVTELHEAGFRDTDTSIFFSENMGSKDFAHEKGSKAPEGYMAGSVFGAVIGSALAWLVVTGVWVIPDLGLIDSEGPVMTLLAGLGVGSALEEERSER